MKRKHSKEPWEVYEYKNSDGNEEFIIMSSERDLARMIRYNERGDLQRIRRDAKLMASAPKLLTALIKIVIHWDDLHPYDRSQARAAINEAVGEDI